MKPFIYVRSGLRGCSWFAGLDAARDPNPTASGEGANARDMPLIDGGDL
jgi:hypothetical protein